MIDIDALAVQVKRNCNISDAKFWGFYSLCGILLRLRELYRIETGLRPYEQIHQSDVGAWITGRESLWRELENKDYENIAVSGNLFSPFSVESINDVLGAEGLIYGAGYGLHMKPSFFLADIQSKKTIDGFHVYITGREYARDLSDNPAMLQDRTIIVRADAVQLLLWQRFEEMRCGKTKEALVFAYSKYRIYPEELPSDDLYNRIQAVAQSEAETYVYHELGEAVEGMRIGNTWKQLLIDLSDGRTQLFARGVKDVLADTSEKGMLKYIIENRKEGSLGFYLVFLGGLRKIIFPEIIGAFQTFVRTGDWSIIEQAREEGYRGAEKYTIRLLELYREKRNTPALVDSIENEILKDLLP
jgi:Family of unknown function (DUF6866) N-terminal domain/Family of unknown function (DUF6866) C-terminal domain